jgi:hypothetical protein
MLGELIRKYPSEKQSDHGGGLHRSSGGERSASETEVEFLLQVVWQPRVEHPQPKNKNRKGDA